MKSTLALALALLALAAAPAPAAADSYLVLKGGYYWPTAEVLLAQAARQKLDPKLQGEIGVGTTFLFFAVELSAGYMKTQNLVVKVTATPVLATVKIRAPILMVAPYLEAGGGIYFAKATPFSGASESKSAFGGHVGGGVDFQVSSVLLGIEARYLFADPGFSMVGMRLDGATLTANLGFYF